MNNLIFKSLTLAALIVAQFGIAVSVYAQEESPTTVEDASCQVQCPEGQAKISFADGNRVNCVCSEAATEMHVTPEEVASCPDANDDGQCD